MRLATIAAAALLVAGCASDARDAVREYIEEANAVEQELFPELRSVARAYQQLRLDPKTLTAQQGDLDRAEATLRRLADRIDRLEPPAEAKTLHAKLERLVELEAELATETAQLARYVPALARAREDLRPATDRLQRQLGRSETTDAQRRALAGYAAAVQGVAAAISRLEAPPALEPGRLAEADRLRELARIAGRLGVALAAGDADEATELNRRLVRLAARVGLTDDQRAAIADYERRLRELSTLRTDIQRERVELESRLG